MASGQRLPLVNRLAQPFVADALGPLGFARGPDAVGLDSVALFVSSGRFCGILPHHYAAQLNARLCLRVLNGTPDYAVTFCAVTDASRALPPSGARLLDLLQTLHTPST